MTRAQGRSHGVELLRGYAPGLDPDEFVWRRMRHEGTSRKPLDKGESVKQRATNDSESTRRDTKLIRSLFRAPTLRGAAA